MLAQYLAKEPAPDERIEAAVAQLATIYVNAHRKKGTAPHSVSDLMLFRDAWKVEEAEPDESIEAFAMSFGGVKRGNNHR